MSLTRQPVPCTHSAAGWPVAAAQQATGGRPVESVRGPEGGSPRPVVRRVTRGPDAVCQGLSYTVARFRAVNRSNDGGADAVDPSPTRPGDRTWHTRY